MNKIGLATLLLISTLSFALEGGPSQPDYTQFEPSGMKDMVSLQSGDFSYQIPLSDIPSPYGNYPLSLSYHAGISPQQEASWVGLGWSLNPGSINRDVRGVPDDQFHGGTLGFIYQYSSTQVWSVNLGYSYGVFSVGQTFSSDGSVGFSATLGPKLEGIVGVGFSVGTDAVGFNASIGKEYGGLNAGLMFSTKNGKFNASAGASIGVAGASLGAQISTGSGASAHVGFGNSTASVGMTVSSNGVSTRARVGGFSISKSKNGASVSVGGGSVSVSNSATSGNDKSSTAGFAIIVPTQIGVFSFGFNQTTYQYWMRSATSEYLYGYMYQAGPAIDVNQENDISGIPDAEIALKKFASDITWKWTMKGRTLESMGREDMSPAYDMYSVSSEGVSGTFRPFARENHQLYKLISNKKTDDYKSVESYSTVLENDNQGWPLSNEFKKDSENKYIPLDSYSDYARCLRNDNNDTCSVYAIYQTNYRNRGNRLLFNSDEHQFEERGGIHFLFVGEGGGYYESENVGGAKNRSRDSVFSNLLRKSVNKFEHALYGSKIVEPIFENSSVIGKLQGFSITTSDGTKYIFKKPIHSYLKVDYSINKEKGVPIFIDKSTNKDKNFWDNFFEGIKDIASWSFDHLNPINAFDDAYGFVFKKGEFNIKCDVNKKADEDYYYSYTVNMNPYATQWLLSEIQGADYVKLNNKSIGYNVKFTYTEPTVYRWRTPYARPGIQARDLPNFRSPRNSFTPEGCDSRMYYASFGVKEYVYLKSIETSTHRVDFELNNQERVDGKGWDLGDSSVIPIYVQTTLGMEVLNKDSVVNKHFTDEYKDHSISWDYSEQNVSWKPRYIYINSSLPQKILDALNDSLSISLNGTELTSAKGYLKAHNKEIHEKRYDDLVDAVATSLPSSFHIIPNTFQKTKGKESKYGLYRLEISSDTLESTIGYIKKHAKASLSPNSISLITIGENGDILQSPYIDWSSLIFAKPSPKDTFDNQMRYLTKISYYRKNDNSDSAYKYKEYSFNYDYSLQPKTLNSYCRGRYPQGDSVAHIINSPDSVGLDICKTDTISKSLYGKLTLRSVTEKGCRNGKCSSLPPFVFSYNSPTATPTRISEKNGWIDYFQELKENTEKVENVYPDQYFDRFDNVDATILASSNTVDEYGFWSNTANPENHKVDQSFADFGAAAWSLNKVVDPTGGNLEVEYERDRYGAGIDYSQDKRTIEFADFNECSVYTSVNSKYSDKLCIQIKPLYWRETCLGPRAAYWDKDKPEGYSGTNDYAYLDSMKAIEGTNLFFNLSLQLKAKVECGIFGWGTCTRHGSVAVVGDGTLLHIQPYGDSSRILVLNRSYQDVTTAALKGALKINDKLKKINTPSRSGYLWTGDTLSNVKAGDLRVKKLIRHDAGLQSLTSYEYADGELAQLADSSYTTVLGSRFYTNKSSYAIPDVHLDPISRIVGIDDDDLIFVPGARITYPKVTVKNSSSDTSNYNGSTEFYYVTPETGIPEQYVDSATKAILKPFIKLNVQFVSMLATDNYDNGRVLRFTLLDEHYQKVSGTDSIRIMAFPDEKISIFFYSNDILSAKYLKVDKMLRGGVFDEKYRLLWDSSSVISSMKTPLTKFNELSLVVYGGVGIQDTLNKVEFIWKRSQKDGFYPILYKQVSYAPENIDIWSASGENDASNGNDSNKGYLRSDSSHVHFERTVTYHDLTAFLGLSYKTVFKRGSGNNAIVIKLDSSFYSTVVPDIIGQNDSVKYKVGRQIEKWSSEQALKCVSENINDTTNLGHIGDINYCRDQQMHLYMRNSSYTDHKDFTYIRYPAFQIGSASFVGHDNQMNGSEPKKFGKTELHNHAYDPLTGSPTATLATVEIENGKVLRKLTQKIPYYAISDTGISSKMFLRNMLTQNYMEAVYTDTLKQSGNAAWNAISSSNKNLRSFSVSPYRFVAFPVVNNLRPIVAWGTYNSKVEPKDIFEKANIYANGDTLPSLIEYTGTHIVSIDSNLKVTEIKDVLDRSMATLFSNDGMYQLSLFYPARKNEVAAILPYRNMVHSTNCDTLKKTVKDGGILMGNQSNTLSCHVKKGSGNFVKEFRMWKSKEGWITKREIVEISKDSTQNKDTTLLLVVPAKAKLNYFRVYPEKAEAKSFIYDNYDNLIQIIAEDNTSTYYEYDPLGNLVQSRNDDGVSFKAHHREYMNDSTMQKMKGE